MNLHIASEELLLCISEQKFLVLFIYLSSSYITVWY